MHPDIKELEFNYIVDGIYIGTNQCCQVHFDEKLKKEGIEVDISLEADKIDHPFGIDFYIWLPVENYQPPKPDQIDFGVSAIEKFVSMKKKVYIHCQNGHGRAPTLVAAYLIKNGKTVDGAIALIASKRPSIHIEDSQKEALELYAQKIKNG